jgi:hypothetical protein
MYIFGLKTNIKMEIKVDELQLRETLLEVLKIDPLMIQGTTALTFVDELVWHLQYPIDLIGDDDTHKKKDYTKTLQQKYYGK